jgi:hypothetical protein
MPLKHISMHLVVGMIDLIVHAIKIEDNRTLNTLSRLVLN